MLEAAQIERWPENTIDQTEPLRVLVVDDSEFDGRRMKRMLQEVDPRSEVTIASTLSDFATKASDRSFDIVFVDYLLPDGDGLDAVGSINLGEANDTPALVMVTGEGCEAVEDSAVVLGFSHYITKNELNSVKLAEILGELLSEQIGTEAARGRMLLASAVNEALRGASVNAIAPARQKVLRTLRLVRALRTIATAQCNMEILEAICTVEANCMTALDSLFEFESYRKNLEVRPKVRSLQGPEIQL